MKCSVQKFVRKLSVISIDYVCWLLQIANNVSVIMRNEVVLFSNTGLILVALCICRCFGLIIVLCCKSDLYLVRFFGICHLEMYRCSLQSIYWEYYWYGLKLIIRNDGSFHPKLSKSKFVINLHWFVAWNSVGFME